MVMAMMMILMMMMRVDCFLFIFFSFLFYCMLACGLWCFGDQFVTLKKILPPFNPIIGRYLGTQALGTYPYFNPLLGRLYPCVLFQASILFFCFLGDGEEEGLLGFVLFIFSLGDFFFFFFFFEFSHVALKVAIVHKRIQPNLTTQEKQTIQQSYCMLAKSLEPIC